VSDTTRPAAQTVVDGDRLTLDEPPAWGYVAAIGSRAASRLFVWAVVLVGGLGSAATADAATACSGTLSHTTISALDVPAGSTCVLEAVTVSSATSVEGTLDASSGGASHFAGPLTINGGAARIVGGSIGGAVKIENTPAASAVDLQAGQGVALTISGAVAIAGNAGSIRLANLSAGTVLISGNSGHVTLVGDHVGGALWAKNDTGGVTLSGNSISGALACTGNSPQPSDAGVANSTGGARSGQCALTGRPGDQHAIDHAYQVTENQTLVVAAPGVLAGSADGAGRPLAAVLVSGPAHGALALNADGSFSYTPNPGFHGSDSFTDTANDGLAASNTATATIQVNAPPVAANDSYNALENGALAVVAPGVLGNDRDPSGLSLTPVVGTGPAHASLTLHADGSFIYTPTAGFHGMDSFTYAAHNAFLGSNLATVTIHVRAPPVAASDLYDVNEGATLTVTAPGVLANDSDPEGVAINAVLAAGPSHGTLTLKATGSFTYAPASGFSGTDSFAYTAHDAFQGSNTASVTIHVRRAGAVVVANANASGAPNYQPQLALVPLDGSPASALTPFGALEGGLDVVMLDPTHALVGGYGTLDRVDITTAAVTPIAVSTPLTAVSGIALDSLGRILISDDGPTNGPQADGRVLRVDPSTAAVTVLSSANHLANPEAITVTPNGQIYVADYENATAGEVININPATGAQTITAGANFILPTGITALPDGRLLAADEEYGGYPGALVIIDPRTGTQSPLSLGSLTGAVPLGVRRVTIDGDGNAVVSAEQPSVDRINLSTGASTQLSTNTLVDPLGLSVIPSTERLAPTCSIGAIRHAGPGGHDQEDIDVRDLGSGLGSITNVNVTNATISVPAFTPGTASVVTITVTTRTAGQPTTWSFDATDADGNVRHCA